jgi:hypothetical protein
LIIGTEINRSYNSEGLLVQESYNYDFDSTLMEFRFRYSVTTEVNEDNTIIGLVYSSIVYREEEGGFIEYRYTTEYELRCDGVYSTRLETTNDNVGGRQTRVTYNYYDKAQCEQDQSGFETLAVFPNPASDYTIIYLDQPIEKGQLRITDNMGRVVLLTDLDGANYFPIDLASYRAGTYIISILQSNGELSKRISIVK